MKVKDVPFSLLKEGDRILASCSWLHEKKSCCETGLSVLLVVSEISGDSLVISRPDGTHECLLQKEQVYDPERFPFAKEIAEAEFLGREKSAK